jgi:type I restriction enzyme M protein
VLPEAVFGMPTYEYVVSWLRGRAEIRGVVSMPEALFKTSGKGGTHAKVCVLFVENTKPKKEEDYEIFMADVKWCGHDSRANPTYRKGENGKRVLLDDIPVVQQRFIDLKVAGKSCPRDRFGFFRDLSAIRNGIFIPKYYDPKLEADLRALKATHELVSIGSLCKGGEEAVLSWDTGIEVGKMAYGTGDIPFIRTSDISNWELKGDPKQNVSEEIYEDNKQDVRAGDIFVVRDGTYLVGISCILTQKDTKILYCGGLYKLRIEKSQKMDPYLLLALLNAPIVRRQMRAKQFTRDIIDTLGKRLFEVLLPIPKDVELAARIAKETRSVIDTRAKLRDRTKEIALEVEGRDTPTADEIEVLENL